MRYHTNYENDPWPFAERLYESRYGFWIGLMFAAIIGCPAFLITLAVTAHENPHKQLPYLILGVLKIAKSNWKTIAFITVWLIQIQWSKTLEVLERESLSFQEVVILRLKRIEERVAK